MLYIANSADVPILNLFIYVRLFCSDIRTKFRIDQKQTAHSNPFVSNFAKVLQQIKESVKQFMDSRIVTDKKTEAANSASLFTKHIRDRCAKNEKLG